eukprot:8460775-Pyramimonas_sp.AAC.1
MTKFKTLADTPTQGSYATQEAEPPQEDVWLPTIHEEAEADLEAHIMEVRHTELQKGNCWKQPQQKNSILHPHR